MLQMQKPARFFALLIAILVIFGFSIRQKVFAGHNSSFSYEADVDAPVRDADEVRDILGSEHVFGEESLPYLFSKRIQTEPVSAFLRIDVLRCKRERYCYMFLEFPESIVEIQKHGHVSLDYRSRKQDFSDFVKDQPRSVRWRLVYFIQKSYFGVRFPKDQFGPHARVASAEVTTRALLWDPRILAGQSAITRNRAGGRNRIIVSKSQNGSRIQILRRNFAFEEDWIAVEVLPRRR